MCLQQSLDASYQKQTNPFQILRKYSFKINVRLMSPSHIGLSLLIVLCRFPNYIVA